MIGARENADLFIRATARDPARLYRVVGLVSDSATRVGRDIGGVPVLGTIDDIREVVARLDRSGERPQRLIISARALDGAVVRSLLDIADELGIPLARLPRLTDFQDDARGRAAADRAGGDRGSARPAADRARPRQHARAGCRTRACW